MMFPESYPCRKCPLVFLGMAWRDDHEESCTYKGSNENPKPKGEMPKPSARRRMRHEHDWLYDNALGHWWCRDCDKTKRNPPHNHDKLIEEMLVVLKSVQWNGAVMKSKVKLCPFCRYNGEHYKCRLVAAIAKAEEVVG